MIDDKIRVGVSYFKNYEPVDNYSDANMATVSVLGNSELSGQLFTVTILNNSIKPSWVPDKNNSDILKITEEELSEFTDEDIDENTDEDADSESQGAAGTFKEEDHPRDEDGKFGDGSGSSTENEEQNTTNNTETKPKIRVSVTDLPEAYQPHVEAIEKVWDELTDDIPEGSVLLLEIGSPVSSNPYALGSYNPETKKITIDPQLTILDPNYDVSITEKKARSILSHEAAHAKYHTLPADVVKKWTVDTESIPPITSYLEKFKTKLDEKKIEVDKLSSETTRMYEKETIFIKPVREHNTGIHELSDADFNDAKRKLDDVRKELEPIQNNKFQAQREYETMKRSFANETFAEYHAIKKGGSVHKENTNSYTKIDKIYKEMFDNVSK